jgi:hypothetical protein
MTIAGLTIGFATPWLLWGLMALPALWLLLRIVPPAAVRRRFPGIVLLLGLDDEDSAAARTPPLLLAIRIAALALAILAFAGPILNPKADQGGSGPLLILDDASWAGAGDWQARLGAVGAALAEARADGRPVALVRLSDPGAPAVAFDDGSGLAERIGTLQPNPWEPAPGWEARLAAVLPEGRFDTLWLSDGLERPGRAELAGVLDDRGRVRVLESGRGVLALGDVTIEGSAVGAVLMRPMAGPAARAEVQAIGLDPNGIERELARAGVDLAAGDTEAKVSLDLPPELRNRVTRLEIAGEATAGAVALTDDALKRRKVALVVSGAPREGLELLSPFHYLRQALADTVDLVEGTVDEVLPAAPDVVVLADLAQMPADEAGMLADWVEEGGLLVRFAGTRLAAAVGIEGFDDPLLPVRLRPGGRAVGGTMSWGAPRAVAPFPETSPFHGLDVPEEVRVTAQVLAEPGPDLAGRTIAALEDGTPLVTRAERAEGQVVLFHVTANAEWSGLPLSGLFVQMLDRLAVSSRPGKPSEAALAGTVWTPQRLLDPYGQLVPPADPRGQPGERFAAGEAGADLPAGLYASEDRALALNVIAPGRRLAAAEWPASVIRAAFAEVPEMPLRNALLFAVVALMLADVLATLAATGRLPRLGRSAALSLTLALPLALAHPHAARAEGTMDEETLYQAADGMILGHVLTGDARVDEVAQAGLLGLSMVLTRRTAVEPGLPVGVDLERDDLSVFTVLYWPVTADLPMPSITAYRKLNRFLQTGGMILFDTRDAGFAGGAQTPEGRRLREIAALLDVPPLEVLPSDHVLTRSFYLIQDFPGRHTGPVWVEAAPPDAEKAEGMPFRTLNDGVSPLVIGGNDWAAAWAVEADGQAMFRLGQGVAGNRQREIAYRFGVNLVMYALTGNYKSDQVHVPALLERLGQ